MRLTMIITLALCSIVLASCNHLRPVMVVSLSGSSSDTLHTIVEECATEYGYTAIYPLILDYNWSQDRGDLPVRDHHTEPIRNNINTLVARNCGDKSDLSLLVVGYSAGGVLAWNTFRRHYDDIDDFHRVALVLVEPHGSVRDDPVRGIYSEHNDLWWPGGWSTNPDFFKVYNIYQHESFLTGASFPRAYQNIRLSGDSIDHDRIERHRRTRCLIIEALNFAFMGGSWSPECR
jgi:pimeloyl-ACP methyl ester carboxylesterase